MAAGLVLGWGGAHACIWDTDTLRDELRMQPGLFDLITGQFPHHGKMEPGSHGISANWIGWGIQRAWPATLLGLAAVLALWHISRRARRSR